MTTPIISTSISQNNFVSAAFVVSSDIDTTFSKYDIRVVETEFSSIGLDALATTVNMQGLIICHSSPALLPIPINNAMQTGTIYKATIRLYSGGQVSHTSVGVFYYDTRTFTVDSIGVSSNPNPNYSSESDNLPHFSHLTPVIKANDVELELNDTLFTYVKFDKVCMSCTNISPTGVEFDANTEYYLGEQSYALDHTYKWYFASADVPLPSDRAYELWGYIQLALSDSFPSLPESFKTPTFAFGFDIVAHNDTVGYNLANPVVSFILGDVVGTVSEHPIKITLTNFNDYDVYKFQSITLKIRDSDDLSSDVLFQTDKNYSDFATATDASKQVLFTATELNDYVNDNSTVNLVNGTSYYFELILNFTDSVLYKPAQQRSVVANGEFDDSLLPITAAYVENSWEVDSSQGAGLVISFKKTDQFLGSRDVPYNLDMSGNTTVLAEYSVTFDGSGNWNNWLPLAGGSITQQANPVYVVTSNDDGIYAVPKYVADDSVGAAQPHDVKIYAVIPDQANYNLVKVRLTLTTNNDSYSVTTSSIFYVARQTDYVYNLDAPSFLNLKNKIDQLGSDTAAVLLSMASFRYFPKAPVHVFTGDGHVPFITAINGNADDGYVADITVPVSVPPYFQAVVTSSGSGDDFGSADPYDYNAADVTVPYVDDNEHDVTGLSYPISFVGDDFVLSVKYVYSENTSIETDVQTKTIQQQGVLPITDPSANVVNSWQLDASQGAGLVVSFKKTAQFMGNSAASYNLDLETNQASVLAEYSITHNGVDWTTWTSLVGGSITQQANPVYELDENNTDGNYNVPLHVADDSVGAAQPDVKIYAVIPNEQANYKLVKVRLTLSADSTEYSPLIDIPDTVADPGPIGISETHDVAPVSTATYPIASATFRYFPKEPVHSFATYKPVIVDISGNVYFNVPVHVPPYFRSSVTTSEGTVNGTASIVSNSVGNSVVSYCDDDVTGLSYEPTADSSFQLSVAYTCDENTAIDIDGVSMTVQMQGFPSESFTISASSWDRTNQQINYTLDISATSTTADRMDGWNMYTRIYGGSGAWTASALGNLLKDVLSKAVDFVDLNAEYPDYTRIEFMFVATRSLYLNSDDTADQQEGVSGSASDIETMSIIKLPAELPPPTADDITVSDIVYNKTSTTTNQSGTLTVSNNSDNIQIAITDPDGAIHSAYSENTVSITLPDVATEYTYTVVFQYDQYVHNVLQIAHVSSSSVTVTFTTGTSERPAPVITEKTSLLDGSFNLIYTSSNTGTPSGDISSIAYVKYASEDAVSLGDADGTGNVGVHQGSEVVLYVIDTFNIDYVVTDGETETPKTANQDIQSPNSLNFYLAANPKIDEESIVVIKISTQSVVRFSVNNNGAPVLHQVVLAVAQDSTDSENAPVIGTPSYTQPDPGYYALCIFESLAGFVANDVAVTDTLGSAHTLKAISITGQGMSKVTSFEFASSTSFASTAANIMAFVKSNYEGADSAAFPNISVSDSDGTSQMLSNGTVKYIGETITSPYVSTLNGTPYLVLPNSHGYLLSGNIETGIITHNGVSYPFNNVVTTLIDYMAGLFYESTFNHPISSWDTSNVLNMNIMFYRATEFNQSIANWNTSQVTNMSSMFEEAAKFNQNISSWNTINVTNMNSMFMSASVFDQNISGWNVAKVTDYSNFRTGSGQTYPLPNFQ